MQPAKLKTLAIETCSVLRTDGYEGYISVACKFCCIVTTLPSKHSTSDRLSVQSSVLWPEDSFSNFGSDCTTRPTPLRFFAILSLRTCLLKIAGSNKDQSSSTFSSDLGFLYHKAGIATEPLNTRSPKAGGGVAVSHSADYQVFVGI